MKKLLLLASSGEEAERIARFSRRLFDDAVVLHGEWGQPLPSKASQWEGDLLISYCSRWIVPDYLIDRAKIAINFHPGPPEYPGVGGLNWAIYERCASFGVTCHRMTPLVDAGEVIEVRRFPLLASDDVEELFRRTHLHLECLANDIIASLRAGMTLTPSGDSWSAVARRRVELDAMMTLSRSAGADEITLRKRAFEFGSWKLNVID
jgi:methionyl-tRNA formyltransferase